jgi:ribonuclease Z
MIRFARILEIALLAVLAAAGSSAQDFKVTLLGTGAPEPRMDRFGPSILVEAGKERLLFDCGRGATQRLYQIHVPFPEATALFLTHLHSDHIVGIPDFWLTGWIRGRKTPLRVWGPVGTTEMMKHLQEAFDFDIHIRRDVDEKLSADGVKVNATDIEEGVVYEKGGVKVTAFLVDHRPVKPAFGYRIDYAGHSVVLSGDTRYSENLIRSAKGTDVLIHEVMDPETFLSEARPLTPEQKKTVIEHHTTPEQAGLVFTAVKPQLAVFSHIVPGNANNLISETRTTYKGPLEIGEDLMTIDIGNKIGVQRPH